MSDQNDETVDEQEAPEAPSKKQSASGAIMFDDEIEIDSSQFLPDFSHGSVKAYRAFSTGPDSQEYLAYLCDPVLLPRRLNAKQYTTLGSPELLPLIDVRKVYWPEARRQYCVFLYEHVLGAQILAPNVTRALGLKYDAVLKSVIKPLIGAMSDLHSRGFVHGSIRPENMFFLRGAQGENAKVVLGDCMTVPSSYFQPKLYETIDRAMADPIGKGLGTHKDDLYALGASIAVLLRHHDPTEGMSDDDIIRMKIDKGSYAVFTNKDRFQGTVIDLLRGLLHDDPAERWSVVEMMNWLEGERVSPRQPWKEKKAPRPMLFNGKKYYSRTLLAMAFSESAEELGKVVENDELKQWVVRALEDEETAQVVDEGIRRAAQGGVSGVKERYVTYLSSALDPMAPLRYKGFSMLPDSLGAMLLQAYVEGKDLNVYAEMISQGIVSNWLKNHNGSRVDVAKLITLYENCRGHLRQSKIGYGLERCLYHLAPQAHCLSDKLEGHYVFSPEGFLRAFEQICRDTGYSSLFFDRHSAAFVAARDLGLISNSLYDLGQSEEKLLVIANLRVMAGIQKRISLEKFPHIAQAFMGMMTPVFDGFHDHYVREKVEKDVARFAKNGDLLAMVGVLDDPSLIQKDEREFEKARQEYRDLVFEDIRLAESLDEKKTFGTQTGKEISAIVASAVAALIILLAILMSFSSGANYGF